MEATREVFETNTLVTIAMTRAMLPQLCARRAGVIVDVTSSVTQRTLHLRFEPHPRLARVSGPVTAWKADEGDAEGLRRSETVDSTEAGEVPRHLLGFQDIVNLEKIVGPKIACI